MKLQVVVVGAGIIGAAVSHQVAKSGARVRVLDVVSRPGEGGATRSTWAWLNANKKHPRHYRDLNLAGLRRWKAEWPSLVKPCGSLLIGEGEGEGERGTSDAPDPEYPFQHLGPDEVRQLEPHLAAAAAARGASLFSQEAWVDPQAACRAMLAAAEEDYGAEVLLGPQQRVTGLQLTRQGATRRRRRSSSQGEAEEAAQPSGPSAAAAAAAGRCDVTRVTGVVTADGSTHPADVVILAAGAEVMPLAAQAGVAVPLLHRPAVSAVTQPLPRRLVRHLLASSDVFVWQRPDGSVMLGDTLCHEDGSVAWGDSLLRRASELVPELVAAGARVERVDVAYRPWPKDGHPIIGGSSACRGLYVVAMHSGMTLAPEVARLVAAELRHWDVAAGATRPVGERAGAGDHIQELQEAQDVLRPYRLERDFQEGARRAAYSWK